MPNRVGLQYANLTPRVSRDTRSPRLLASGLASGLAVFDDPFNLHELFGVQVTPLTHLCFSVHVLTHLSLSEVELFFRCSGEDTN